MPDHSLPALPERPARPVPVARVVNWTPWPHDNPSLIGHCTVAFSGGWVVHQVPVFRTKNGGISVGVPSAAQIDRDGRVKTDLAGKRQYVSIMSFETAAGRERWQTSIMGALADAGIGLEGGGA